MLGEIKTIDLSRLPKPKGPGVVWTVDSALKVLTEKPLVGRSLENGRKMLVVFNGKAVSESVCN